MKENTDRKEGIPIYIQAAAALMLIQLVHKIVREIPGSLGLGGPGVYVTVLLALLLLLGMVLVLFRVRWGLVFGFLDGAWMLFQPVLVHIIWAEPDINGIWWYPLFPWVQALLLIYFCALAWRRAPWR
jgi:hypothetical protein